MIKYFLFPSSIPRRQPEDPQQAWARLLLLLSDDEIVEAVSLFNARVDAVHFYCIFQYQSSASVGCLIGQKATRDIFAKIVLVAEIQSERLVVIT